VEALEVGDLGREVLDAPRLDPQLFERQEPGRQRWICRTPCRFVAPIGIRRRREDDRREARILNLAGRNLMAVFP
jgi:hypothetical protein